MKKSAFIMGLMTTSAFATVPQQFYRAADEMNLVELNSQMDTITSEKGGDTSDKIGSTNFDFTFSRGITKDIAVGLSTGYKNEGHGSGAKDINLFVEGQYDKYFYGFNLAISADIELDDDDHPENAKSGGMNTTVTLGYTPVENLGIRLDYTPGYTSIVQPKAADYIETDTGPTIWAKGFYEHDLGKSILGGAFGGLKVSPNKDNTDLDEKYNTCEMYYNYKLYSSLELTANLHYWFGNKRRYFDLHREGLDINVRFKF